MEKMLVGLQDTDGKVLRNDAMCLPAPEDKDKTMPGM